MMGPLPDGVVANGESNGEPELLEWLSDDCTVVPFQAIVEKREHTGKKVMRKKSN